MILSHTLGRTLCQAVTAKELMIQLPPLQLCTHSPALSGLDKDDIKNKNKMEKKNQELYVFYLMLLVVVLHA